VDGVERTIGEQIGNHPELAEETGKLATPLVEEHGRGVDITQRTARRVVIANVWQLFTRTSRETER
jgi:hypothetical protein